MDSINKSIYVLIASIVIFLIVTLCFGFFNRVLLFYFLSFSALLALLLKKYYLGYLIEAGTLKKEELRVLELKNSTEEALKNKINSFNSVQKKVNEMFDLFEVSRDFNETLDFESLIKVLRQKINESLYFRRAQLIVSKTNDTSDNVWQNYFSSEKDEDINVIIDEKKLFEILNQTSN